MAWSAPRTWTAGETLTAALLNTELRDNLNAAEPVGELHYYIRSATTVATLINAFALETNGVAVSRTTYAALNTLLNSLGYPFGVGDGSTTMNLPDVQGRSLVAMASGGHADVNALGDSDGLAKASRTPEDTINITVSDSVTGGSVTVGNNGTISYQSGGSTSPTIGSPGTPALTGASFSDSVSDAVAGNYLVGGVYAVKAF